MAKVALYPAVHYDGVGFFGDKRGQAPPHLSLRSESTSREMEGKGEEEWPPLLLHPSRGLSLWDAVKNN